MSLTQAQMFEQFKAEKPGMTWRAYWENLCLKNLELYHSLGFHLIPIAKHRKAPLRGEAWAEPEYKLKPDVALKMLCDGFNIAVVAGLSGLVLLDHDAELPASLKPLALETMTEKTPRGYCIFTAEPFDRKLWKQFSKRFPTFDNPRVDIMYALVPPSRTCVNDFRGMDSCTRHDLRVREWVSSVRRPMPFKEFVESATNIG